jgi:hypothetical protein
MQYVGPRGRPSDAHAVSYFCQVALGGSRCLVHHADLEQGPQLRISGLFAHRTRPQVALRAEGLGAPARAARPPGRHVAAHDRARVQTRRAPTGRGPACSSTGPAPLDRHRRPDAVPLQSGRHDPLQRALLSRHRIEVPVMPFPAPPARVLQVAAQVYNSEEQVHSLAAALRALLAEMPRG